MGFYYISLLSIFPLAVAYAVLGVIYWRIARAARGLRWRKAILSVVGVVFLLLPISEELWIAGNFGQACKEAGIFIIKKVSVDGFYDDTSHWWRQLADSKYKFVESREQGTKRYWKVERIGNEIRHFQIGVPSARYHFRMTDPINGTRWAHKVTRSGSVVIDTEAHVEIARYVSFGRRAPWFFVGLDTPGFACDSPSDWPYTKGSRLIYREALIPAP